MIKINFNKDGAFGMPVGTVRGLIAIIVIVATVGLAFMKGSELAIGAVLSMSGLVIDKYFRIERKEISK